MNPQTAFKLNLATWLKQQASLIALLYDTNLADCRIYPFRQPQGTLFPELSWWIPKSVRHKDMSGPIGLTTATVQFDSRGYSFADADAVADAIRGLDGFADFMNGMRVQAFLVQRDGNGTDDADNPIHGDEVGTAMVSVSAKITYEEPS